MSDPLNGKKWPMALGFVVCAIVAVWYWGINIRVLSFGTTYLTPAVASPGDAVQIHFEGIRWYRLCASKMTYQYICVQSDPKDIANTVNARVDFIPYEIGVPMQSGSVTPKARDLAPVPMQCLPGPLTYSAFVRSECFPLFGANPIYTKVPEASLMVH